MWILYLVIAIIISTGAGVYVSQNSDISTRDVARVQAPQVHGEEANRIARYLRRLYQDSPSLFPAKPKVGAPPVVVPTALVNRSLTPGYILPEGVRFVLQSDGAIVPVFVATNGPRGNLIAQTANRVIEREGSNPDLYNRLDSPTRSTKYGTITKMAALPSVAYTNAGNVGVRTTGGGADAIAAAANETETGQVDLDYEWDDGSGSVTYGGGPTTPSQPDTSIVGESEDNADTIEDVGTVKGFGDLKNAGGTGGTTNTDVNSYYRSGGTAVVAKGYERWRGPTAHFYSSTNLDRAINANASLVSAMTPLVFETPRNPGAPTRIAAENRFDAACRKILTRADGNFATDLATYKDVVRAYYTETRRDTKLAKLDEEFEQIEGALATSAMYCMGVYTGRSGDFPLPIRAPQAHPRNMIGLNLSVKAVQDWQAQNPDFMAAMSVVYSNNRTGKTYHRYIAEMAAFKTLMSDIVGVKTALDTYPAPLS